MDRKTMELKFGLKLPAIRDIRTIPLPAILRLRLLPPLPESWNVNEEVGGVDDNFIFGNDKHGDCVKAAFAHQTLRFEKFEQGIQIEILAQEVIDEYYRETGGADSGLYLALAMKDWRNHGLGFGDRIYDIYAYAGVDHLDHTQVKYSIYLLDGLIFGMQVFQTDIDQFRAGEPWHLTSSNGDLLGGHGVYGFSYFDSDEVSFEESPIEQNTGYAKLPNVSRVLSWSDKGLWCVTWGVEQFMTWDFWDARVNQAYAVVDNRNEWQGDDSPVNIPLLESYLQEITGGTEPSDCPFANAICWGLDKLSAGLRRKSRFQTVVYKG